MTNNLYEVKIPDVTKPKEIYDHDEGLYIIMRVLGAYAFSRKHSWCEYADDLPHGFVVDGCCGSGLFYQNPYDLMCDLHYNIDDVFYECRNYQWDEDGTTNKIYIRAVWFAQCKEACFVRELIKDDSKRIRIFNVYEDEEWPFYYDHPKSDSYSAYFGIEPDKKNEPDFMDKLEKHWFASVDDIAEITNTTIKAE